VRWRVLIQIGALGPEIGKFLIAFIAQEQCFAAVADEHKRVMGYWDSLHGVLGRQTFAPVYSTNSLLTLISIKMGMRFDLS
jgi:hypothetical protein